MKNFAVVLSGCGVYDGSEIHEATLSMLAIAKKGCTYTLFAPNVEQYHVINHLTGEEMKESRNVLVESARIARGKIRDLKQFNAGDFDILLFPGGYGAAKNLSTYAYEGEGISVLPEVEDAIRAMTVLGKPVGALCISPVILAKVFGKVSITVGDDDEAIDVVESLGATNVPTTHGEVVVDSELNLATTPCYQLDATIDQIMEGADNIVDALIKMTNE